MPSRGLPVNVDSQYADDATHPDVKIHQQHHDAVHAFVNLFDDGAPPDGAVFFYNASTGLWTALDPAISGSPGPPGIQGHGVRWRGAWSAVTAYTVYNGTTVFADDLVQASDGSVYITTANSTNSPPPSGPWDLFAAAGADGVDGQQGIQGVRGDTGAPGPAEEVLEVDASPAGSLTCDAAAATFFQITLVNDLTILLADTAGSAVSAITLEIKQGAGAPWDVTWGTGITWFTEDGLAPTLATALNTFDVITFYQVNGEWRGFTPGGSGTAPPVTFPTLGLEVLAHQIISGSANIKLAGAPFVFSTAVQLGNQRGGLCLVNLDRGDSIDPADPTLTGGGASTWIRCGSTTHANGTTRRRYVLFAAYDTTTGVSAPLTVTPGSGADHTGCAVQMVRSTGIVPSNWATYIQSKTKVRNYLSGGESQLTPTMANAALAAPATGSRVFVGIAGNNTAVLTPSNFTVLQQDTTAGSPHLEEWCGWNPTTFQTIPAGTFSINVNWGMIATEMPQG